MENVRVYTHETHPKKLKPRERIRLVLDDAHETRGSFALGDDEADCAAEAEEIENLGSGRWIALGRVHETQCEHCAEWRVDAEESLFGIVFIC